MYAYTSGVDVNFHNNFAKFRKFQNKVAELFTFYAILNKFAKFLINSIFNWKKANNFPAFLTYSLF
jgi:hypothetical protein